jgi:hypothetical protein
LDDTELHVCGSVAYSCYVDNKVCVLGAILRRQYLINMCGCGFRQDLHHVLMGDVINDMIGCHLPIEPGGMELAPDSKKHAVLACGDRSIYVVRGSAKVYNVALQSVPTVLCAFDPDARACTIYNAIPLMAVNIMLANKDMRTARSCTARKGARLVCCSWPSTRLRACGSYPTTNDLAVGLLCLHLSPVCIATHDMMGVALFGWLSFLSLFLLLRAAVQCMATHPLSTAQARNVLLGRNDGNVEVYSVHEGGPRCVFKTRLSAGITGIVGGRVSSPDFDEVVVSTYAGQVIGFSTEVVAQIDPKASRQREIER